VPVAGVLAGTVGAVPDACGVVVPFVPPSPPAAVASVGVVGGGVASTGFVSSSAGGGAAFFLGFFLGPASASAGATNSAIKIRLRTRGMSFSAVSY
jgi:hypothetical protein